MRGVEAMSFTPRGALFLSDDCVIAYQKVENTDVVLSPRALATGCEFKHCTVEVRGTGALIGNNLKESAIMLDPDHMTNGNRFENCTFAAIVPDTDTEGSNYVSP